MDMSWFKLKSRDGDPEKKECPYPGCGGTLRLAPNSRCGHAVMQCRKDSTHIVNCI